MPKWKKDETEFNVSVISSAQRLPSLYSKTNNGNVG